MTHSRENLISEVANYIEWLLTVDKSPYPVVHVALADDHQASFVGALVERLYKNLPNRFTRKLGKGNPLDELSLLQRLQQQRQLQVTVGGIDATPGMHYTREYITQPTTVFIERSESTCDH